MADAAIPGTPPIRGVELEIDDAVLEALREELPAVATETVAAIIVEVPSYTGALSGSMGDNITAAVQMALAGFLKLAGQRRATDPSTPLGATREGAYALGRGEARSGRSMDALLAAYRVGARVAWRELAQTAARAGLDAETMAEFAELVFAYIDELSAASVAGHSDELSTSGRVRERYLARLGQDLLAGARPDVLTASAERAGWTPPRTLTAVLLPAAQVRGAVSLLSPDTLQVGEDLPGLVPAGADPDGEGARDEQALLLVPDMEGPSRRHLLRVLRGRSAVVGPVRPWTQARTSYLRVVRLLDLTGRRAAHRGEPVDTEDHLVDLVVSADPEALADLRAAALAPLSALRSATAQRLAETLLSWLLHQGRREAVAEDLHVHAQTVRYRMGRLRELYGERLDDPRSVLELVLALQPAQPGGTTPGPS
jgi:hypothetical protein